MSESDSRARKTGSKYQGGIAHKVPCGKCPECLRRRQSSWVFRLKEELKVSTSAVFLTLTYMDDWIPTSFNGNQTLDKTDWQKFMKRLRKKLGKNGPKLKYYTCGEYGSRTQRPHLHAILFNLPQEYLSSPIPLTAIWNMGIVSVDECNMATITYVTKYMMKGRFEPQDELDDREPEFALMSKKLGLSHLTPAMIKYYRENFQTYVNMPGGVKQSMPRYFRERIFNKDERILLNLAGEEAREKIFEEEFNNSFKDEHTWKIDQYRKAERKIREERQKF